MSPVTESPIAPELHICGPTNVIEMSRRPDGEERWCFVCRKRTTFEFIVRRDDVEEDWYGPWPAIECAGGHQNGDLFPGRWREWEA